ncbi:FdxN element excision controlling factor protein [Candidatus Moduliflexus flocculans]|uniref:FdxN element excision controlling factor protein n=1 Tax=Candidatus Moduliflexus flocculans TaxID=1499966 RepID=A0A081BPT7_9BACT|nr:FdxN element excision controlling factor protein [Candidatus Moduliflexus flocculans]
MPAKDKYHQHIKNALIKDGWTITHDPYMIDYEEITVYADLGAERLIAAERGVEKIVVEIKSFLKRSLVQDLKEALGQYEL